MSNKGPLVLIDDDADDLELFINVLNELHVTNEVVTFHTPVDAMVYLKSMLGQPFLIVCDVNLPKQSGLEFKKAIEGDETLRRKSIPFIFFSTSVDRYVVTKAYEQLTIQGFFKKEYSYTVFKDRIKAIVDYWGHCEHPSNFD